jgi:poly(3-hydroxybutyrate) depolymerase
MISSVSLTLITREYLLLVFHLAGGMCFALAGQLSDKIATIANVAGAMLEDQLPEIIPETPLSVLNIHGTKDPVIPWLGGNSSEIKVKICWQAPSSAGD